MRNRCCISRKGPLIVYGAEGSKLVKAFRNIPVVEVVNVVRLNLLKLAPGGHLGRFVIWTKSAFEKLDSIYGSVDKVSEKKKKKKGYLLPWAKMVNADLPRIINSDEVQSVVRPIKKEVKRATMKKNPLKNLNAILKLNRYAKTAWRMALLAEVQRVKAKTNMPNAITFQMVHLLTVIWRQVTKEAVNQIVDIPYICLVLDEVELK